MPFGATFIVGSMVTPVIVRRVRPADLITGGLVMAAVGFWMLTLVDGPADLPILVTAFVVYSFGLAPVVTLATDIIVGSAPPERAGAASAISETGSEFGGALGIAILGSIGTAVYRRAMSTGVSPAVPHDVADAARDTLGRALAIAGELPHDVGTPLLQVARAAFSDGLQLAAIISAAVVLATAGMTVVMLRDVGSGTSGGEL
jgi:DHA2 family multidrug resistance protein-like MFS transporter